MMNHLLVPCSQTIIDLVEDHLGLLHATIEVGLDSVVLVNCSVSLGLNPKEMSDIPLCCSQQANRTS